MAPAGGRALSEPGSAGEAGGRGENGGRVLGWIKGWWFIIAAAGLWLLTANRAIDRIDGLQAAVTGLQQEQSRERERLAALEAASGSLEDRFTRLVGYLAGGPAFSKGHPGRDD